MSVLCGTSFPAQNHDRNGVVVVSGSPAYVTGTLPSDSAASVALECGGDVWRRPWYNGAKSATLRSPSGTNIWFHARVRLSINNTTNDTKWIGIGSSGTEMFTLSWEDNTGLVTIRVAGVVRATAVAAAFSVDNYERWHFTVDNQNGGSFNVYQDGDLSTPVLTYSLTATDITNLTGLTANEFVGNGTGSGTMHVTDIAAIDPDDGVGGSVNTFQNFAQISFERKQPTGNGNYTAWTGAYTDVDEIPFNDSDLITATAVDDAETFTFPSTSHDRVLWVQSYFRTVRSDATTGVNAQIRMRESATDLDETSTSFPGDGDIIQQHHAGVTGAWSTTRFNGTEFGIVART